MSKKFVRKNLEESKDIQNDYDYYNYFDAVLKCRIYLESWLGEYIFAILYPAEDEATKQNRQFVLERFDDMFYQLFPYDHQRRLVHDLPLYQDQKEMSNPV